MYVLAAGAGTWDGTITNPTNPQRRDVQQVQANGYMVAQFDPTHAGFWPFHCHIGMRKRIRTCHFVLDYGTFH